eukprot:10351782-Karenia_brevis.AAC.1
MCIRDRSLTPEECARIGWNPECAGEVTTGPSIFYESVWFQWVKYKDIPHGYSFNMIWNPALEARPDHICHFYGDTRGMEVKHIVLSPLRQGRATLSRLPRNQRTRR